MSTKNLIALAVIAAGVLAAGSAEIQKGEKFTAPDDVADKLIADGVAKLDDAKATKVSTKKVRVLVDCIHGKCNDVVEMPTADVDSAKKHGFVDDSKAAVDYAASLPQNQPKG